MPLPLIAMGASALISSASNSGFLGGLFGSKGTNNPQIVQAADQLYPTMVAALNSGSWALAGAHNSNATKIADAFSWKDEEASLMGTGVDRAGDFIIGDDKNKWVGLDAGANKDPKTWHSQGEMYTPSTGVRLTIKTGDKRTESSSTGAASTSALIASASNIPTWIWYALGGLAVVVGFIYFKKKGRR